MNYKEQILLIQKLAGLTQDELAKKLGVTFVALNRWLNNKAVPRRKIQEKINKLYLEISGQKKLPANLHLAKEQIIKEKSKSHTDVLNKILKNPDIQDQLILELTYNSNSIEGSTLSENETAAIIFQNKTFPSKSVIEHLEAKNHQAALEFLFNYLIKNKLVNEVLILKLHSVLMNGIHSDAGFYRRHGVRIVGSNIPTANHVKVPYLMEQLIKDLNRKSSDSVSQACEVHAKFEQIHPFGDGNGRVGRLILNAMLIKQNISPAIIKQKHKYYSCLNIAQAKENFAPLKDFVIDSILDGYKILERIT